METYINKWGIRLHQPNLGKSDDMQQSVKWWVGLIFFSLAVVLLDYLTRQYTLFPIFFVFPVLFATWRLGLMVGVGFAAVLSGFRFALIVFDNESDFSLAPQIVNMFVRFGVLCLLAALTHRVKKLQQQAQYANDLVQSHLNAVNKGARDAFVTFDLSGIITSWNKTAEQLFGYGSHEMVSHPVEGIFPALKISHLPKTSSSIKQQFERLEIETETKHRNGLMIPVSLTLTAIQNTSGLISGYIAIIRDTSDKKLIEGVISEGRERFELALENAGHGYWDWNVATGTVYLDPAWKAIYGFKPDELESSYASWETRIHPEDLPRVLESLSIHLKSQQMRYDVEYRAQKKDGTWIWLITRGRVIQRDREGKPLRMIGTVHDITERKESVDALRLQEERFRKAFDFAPIGLALVSPEGRWLRVNQRICEIVGYAEEELFKIDFQTITHPEDLSADLEFVQQLLKGEVQTYQMEKRYFHKEGQTVHVLLSVSLVRDNANKPLYFISQIKDITASKLAEDQLKKNLREKETMLQEIHHRVKNNLAVVASLFYLQSRYTQDPNTLRILQECQDRVRSMALVHERLYGATDLANINFADYTRELANSLHRNYSVSVGAIRLQLNLEPVSLNIDKAIPCGLILNELISNAFKHGFPNGQVGEIRVSLLQTPSGEITLTVSDSGVGIPEEATQNTKRSLGMRLIHTLTKQVDGQIIFNNQNPGTEAKLTMGAYHAQPL